ncbi:MAG: hypothetical protein KIT00_02775 [Rhodospirillales bacterium]|nr:hypothetical protein [Rhodospirillales bacterium]
MTDGAFLPTGNPSSGFWAASLRHGYDAHRVWAAATAALFNTFELKPIEARDFLDSQAGKQLADDLAFIEGGPVTAEAIETLMRARLEHLGWRRWYAEAITAVRIRRRR